MLNETIYLLRNQTFFKIHVNHFIIQDDLPCASSVQALIMSDSLQPYTLQHARLTCPSSTPGAYSNSCSLSQWCNATSSSVVPFSSCLQSFPASEFFPMSQFFASGIGVSVSASVFTMSSQDWFPLEWAGGISWQSKGLSKVFSNTMVQKHQFFSFLYSLTLKSTLDYWKNHNSD